MIGFKFEGIVIIYHFIAKHIDKNGGQIVRNNYGMHRNDIVSNTLI